LKNRKKDRKVRHEINMQRKTVLIVAAVACVSVGLGAWAVVGGQAGIQYRTAAVEHGDISVAISSTGNPNAVVTVQVGTQVSGVVMAARSGQADRSRL